MTEASSIGKVGEPYVDEANKRVKWLCTDPVLTSKDLENKLEIFNKSFGIDNTTRITARLFVKKNLLGKIGEYVEATIPLDGRFSDFSLVYLGRNTKDRLDSHYLCAAELEVARLIYKYEKSVDYGQAVYSVTSKNGFDGRAARILDDINPLDVVDLYKNVYNGYTFDLNEDNVKKLLQNQSNVKAFILKDKKVVSIGVAELCEVSVGKKKFTFAELSDAATHKEYQNSGLYIATSSLLMKYLSSMNVDLVYGEARAAHIGVNIACRRSGRQFYGVLQKHCVISGHKDFNEKGPYENLNVWALSGNSLAENINGD